jgi:hypothetical protein
MLPVGFESLEDVSPHTIPAAALARSLASVGIRRGEVFTVVAGRRKRRFEIGCERP